MFAECGLGWMTLVQSGITGGAGLLGVIVGGIFTSRNQKRERRNAHYVRQLQEFYSPLLGMKVEIKAKTLSQAIIEETAKKVHKETPKGEERTHDLMSVYRYG